MDHLLTKWHSEDDPVTREQVEVLKSLLNDQLTERALEGFLVVCSRFVDEFGHHRTDELANVFRTDLAEGQAALLNSLEYMSQWVGGMESYLRKYPVTIIPPKPAFPQFKIIGIESLASRLYRVLDSRCKAYPTNEHLIDYIQKNGRLPAVPIQKRPARRTKPRFHWCSYECWDNPEVTREMLQIMPEWSDCRLRVTIPTSTIKRSAYVAFNGEHYDPSNHTLHFYKYFYEPLAQDHPSLCGGGTQVGVQGAPQIDTLELWDQACDKWSVIWQKS